MAKRRRKKRHTARKAIITLILLAIVFIVLCYLTASAEPAGDISEVPGLEIPIAGEKGEIVSHTGYTLSYSEEHELPSWVAYVLTREEVLGGGERADDFRPDPAIRTGSAELSDYRGSGYDRGHMAPAADFKWSEEAMSDTFYMSNMAPQEPSFNRGIWADLEAVVRTFAYDNQMIYVVTGPVLTDGPYDTIGENGVSIPKRFYKTVLVYSPDRDDAKAIAFVLPNEGSDSSLKLYAMSIDDAEEITGIDFYPALPDEDESRIESSFSTAEWSFREFIPSSDMPTSSQIDYVRGNDAIEIAVMLFNKLKTSLFETLGAEDLARSLGLL